jgi:N-acetylmuramoyl-L-alanine amidase
MIDTIHRFTLSPASRAAVLAGLVLCGAAVPAAAQSANVRYERAQARERTLRAAAEPTLASLRALAISYEAIVRRYPTSGYADNALWQAAGVLQLAWERAGQASDREGATRLLQWLQREYPSSSLRRQVPARLMALRPRQAPARTAAATPSHVPPRPAATSPPSPAVSAPRSASARTTPAATTPTADPAVAGPTGRDTAAALPAADPAADAAAEHLEPPRVDAEAAPEAPAAASSETAPRPSAMPVASPSGASVRSIAYTKLPKGDRITLELTREAAYRADRRSGAEQLVVRLDEVAASAAVLKAAAAIRGTHVESLRLTPPSDDALELQVSLRGAPRLSTFPLYDPYRVVIDLEADAVPAPPAPAVVRAIASRDAATSEHPDAVRASTATPSAPNMARGADRTVAAAPAPVENSPAPPASTRKGDYSLARQLGLGVSRIVIDPGHGGHDPGAQANGISESALVLDVALRLEKLLSAQPGFDVVLTRRTDVYIPLDERTAIANREGADLFLSIHANASPQRDTRGIETFVLNFATNPQAEAVAARENASSARTMNTLPEIVKAIALNNKLDESRELASMVQTSLMRRLGPLNKSIKDLGVKQAPFVVLIGAQMPSVLSEISFLTNRSEAALLKQSAHRERIAQALCDAVLKYQASLKKVTTVAGR